MAINFKVALSTGELGYIESSFGQSGKAKIRICGSGLNAETKERLLCKSRRKKENNVEKAPDAVHCSEPVTVDIKFKRYIYDLKRTMIQ